MATLSPRIRMIGIRLSESEFSALEKFCAEIGARSISDFARSAISSCMGDGHGEKHFPSRMEQYFAQVKDLEQKVKRLSTEIALLKIGKAPRKNKPATAGTIRKTDHASTDAHSPQKFRR